MPTNMNHPNPFHPGKRCVLPVPPPLPDAVEMAKDAVTVDAKVAIETPKPKAKTTGKSTKSEKAEKVTKVDESERATTVPGIEPKVETWDVVLQDAGTDPIGLVRVIREITSMDLKDIEMLLSFLPDTVSANLSSADAEAMKAKLEAAGAKAALQSHR